MPRPDSRPPKPQPLSGVAWILQRRAVPRILFVRVGRFKTQWRGADHPGLGKAQARPRKRVTALPCIPTRWCSSGGHVCGTRESSHPLNVLGPGLGQILLESRAWRTEPTRERATLAGGTAARASAARSRLGVPREGAETVLPGAV